MAEKKYSESPNEAELYNNQMIHKFPLGYYVWSDKVNPLVLGRVVDHLKQYLPRFRTIVITEVEVDSVIHITGQPEGTGTERWPVSRIGRVTGREMALLTHQKVI
ncbi:hypothetical protein A2767_04095 [Candidatus Roizmanbacteria bacterium RIFCSPHIGHO2_01_FULL_35_10]|uniref:Uncharacterized protein n=1 Tax=Candidatus Roizmanbacteria bacterium RIFCSPLOWO2_01_FULL_35_13 TaxID=1802055 RepID=A0A1F7IH52_9BACT|nr:MAG: hypothetical protein A2767_04095 [Candidatus Roizmanbacteria bacterium RIFCSPHIGHO2_01_FULL_35_10]OGK42678.1 MAG: hypothetical protein A3A74_00020 [Candidatus Roizmanbacteria bacterium RIFCSPLOWO2_01_FULL_35_13]